MNARGIDVMNDQPIANMPAVISAALANGFVEEDELLGRDRALELDSPPDTRAGVEEASPPETRRGAGATYSPPETREGAGRDGCDGRDGAACSPPETRAGAGRLVRFGREVDELDSPPETRRGVGELYSPPLTRAEVTDIGMLPGVSARAFGELCVFVRKPPTFHSCSRSAK